MDGFRLINRAPLMALTLIVVSSLLSSGAVFAFELASLPCSRMTESAASQAFGAPVKRAISEPCRFEAAESKADYFTIEIQPGQAENSSKLMQPLIKIYGNPDPVNDVGDHAYSFESVLIVLYRKDYFTVSIFSSRLTRQHKDVAAAKAIARSLISLF